MSVPSMTRPARSHADMVAERAIEIVAQTMRDLGFLKEDVAAYVANPNDGDDAVATQAGERAIEASHHAELMAKNARLRARAVPERPVVTLPAKLVVWAIAAACGVYCIAIWVGVA